jgi:hypothetical protein
MSKNKFESDSNSVEPMLDMGGDAVGGDVVEVVPVEPVKFEGFKMVNVQCNIGSVSFDGISMVFGGVREVAATDTVGLLLGKKYLTLID